MHLIGIGERERDIGGGSLLHWCRLYIIRVIEREGGEKERTKMGRSREREYERERVGRVRERERARGSGALEGVFSSSIDHTSLGSQRERERRERKIDKEGESE